MQTNSEALDIIISLVFLIYGLCIDKFFVCVISADLFGTQKHTIWHKSHILFDSF